MWFGAGLTDWVFTTVTADGEDDLAQLTADSVITLWNAETGGTQYTDLLDEDGEACTFVNTADGTGPRPVGTIPPFQGPDGITAMWAQADDGSRAQIIATNVGDLIAAATAAAESAASAAAAAETLGAIAFHPARPPITPLSTFQAGHGWTVLGDGTSGVDDTDTYLLGTQSLQATSSGDGNGTFIRKTGLSPVDVAGKIFRILIRVGNLAHLESMNLYLGDGNFTNYYIIPIWDTGDGKTIIDSEWQWLEFGFAGAEDGDGTPSTDAITDWQLRYTDDATAAVTVHINAIGYVDQDTAWPNGVVSIVFDDTTESQFTTARPILDAHCYQGCAAVLVEAVGASGSMTLDQLIQLREFHGWDISGHGYSVAAHNAPYTALSADELDSDLKALKAWMVSNAFHSEWMAYPQGAYDAEVERAVARYFSAARTIVVNPRQVLPCANPYRLRSKTVANTTPTAQLTELIDDAYDNGSWLILTFHSIVAAPAAATEYATADFTTVINYLAAKGIPVRTISDVLASVS